MKRSWLIVIVLLLGLGLLVALLWQRGPQGPVAPHVPALLTRDLPPQCRQMILVLLPQAESVSGRLWLMERSADAPWHMVDGPIRCTVGHKGLAWGDGEHHAPMPAGFRVKQEGDKCSPAGVFRVPFAFGLSGSAAGLKLPYTPLTQDIIGVDDPKSRYYNQIVDRTKVERDWNSNEAMVRHDKLYEWGAFIAHNPEHKPGGGSCIFLHVWPGPGKGTAGCTAMAVDDLKRVLGWLDPAQEPRLVQGLESWE